MKCKKCGSEVFVEIIATLPPQVEYRCLKCGIISEGDVERDIDVSLQPKPIPC